MKNVNQIVQELIDVAGFTQKQLAEQIGVSQATISDLYREKQIDIGIEKGGRKLEALYITHCSIEKAA